MKVSPFDKTQQYIWAIQSLSRLTCISFKEDKYGIVQMNESLPIVFRSLLSCLFAIEMYVQQISTVGISNVGLEGYKLLDKRPQAISTVLNTCIYELVITFYSSLQEFTFPPKYALRLQSFVEFKS